MQADPATPPLIGRRGHVLQDARSNRFTHIAAAAAADRKNTERVIASTSVHQTDRTNP